MNESDSARRDYVTPVLCGILIFCLGSLGALFFPLGRIVYPSTTSTVQTSRTLQIASFQYAEDHGKRYLTGTSSTEICQKLLDSGYLTDPAIFYIPMPGKIEAVAGAKLKPENVCWDFTNGLDDKSNENIPIVFMTGYRVTYAAGTDAIPLIKPYPPFGTTSRPPNLWKVLFDPDKYHYYKSGGLAVCFRSTYAVFAMPDPAKGIVPNFIRPAFRPDGHTYVQLTPGGSSP